MLFIQCMRKSHSFHRAKSLAELFKERITIEVTAPNLVHRISSTMHIPEKNLRMAEARKLARVELSAISTVKALKMMGLEGKNTKQLALARTIALLARVSEEYSVNNLRPNAKNPSEEKILKHFLPARILEDYYKAKKEQGQEVLVVRRQRIQNDILDLCAKLIDGFEETRGRGSEFKLNYINKMYNAVQAITHS